MNEASKRQRLVASREAGIGIFELVVLFVLLLVCASVVRTAASWLFDEPLSHLAWAGATVALYASAFAMIGIAGAVREGRVRKGGVVSSAPAPTRRDVELRSPDGSEQLVLSLAVDPEQSEGGRLLAASLHTAAVSSTLREAWFDASAIAQFLAELAELERTGSGSATLRSHEFDSSPSGLAIELSARDPLGHISLRTELAEIRDADSDSPSARTSVRFDLDPTPLSTSLRALRSLLS